MTHLRVQELTKARKWSIARLAKRARLDYGVAYRYYHDPDKDPDDRLRQYDANVLNKLAWALDVEVGELFGGAAAPKWDDKRALVAALA